MRSSIFAVSILFAVFINAQSRADDGPATAPAHTLTGGWTLTYPNIDRSVGSAAELKEAGGSITGTITSGNPRKALEIKEGRISGDKLQFTIERKDERGVFLTTYSGVLEGDRMSGIVEYGYVTAEHPTRPSAPWIGTRIKSGGKVITGER